MKPFPSGPLVLRLLNGQNYASLPTHPLVHEALVSKSKGNDHSGRTVYLAATGPQIGGICEGSEGGQGTWAQKMWVHLVILPRWGPGLGCHGYRVPGAPDPERATPHQLPEKRADGSSARPAPGNPEAAETLLR